ncbi:hypothetical protein JHK82_030850 [Glycine max]|nr:hypothetical protein JHK87_030763 [Glycine soja]KAG4988511.1 hypothetical protein JHK85_031494 [Glycine max]KAG4994118.1 hypothetical protein JHK86_030945 [Glycine max]KAG5124113.1 hypothetical protein JHK82_030850 [Glycine max]KAG5145530.1 hypothetical protein JHK84_031073 [Glycine max]
MAIKKVLILVIYIFIVQSSSSSLLTGRIYQTNMAGSGSIATNKEVLQDSNEAASVGIVEDSAREVPTGPDPLHHINHPIGH